ncbi:LysR family transcriptional regulator [Photobacterium sp. DNB23_23_1]|uniref:LysR family transcriptional regulator n=1 Tax=Photobacterium pectinilyticum TaxID=2906793 RepID=A0ABT1MYW6_9GAMM|nr:LysR family transcriptional regulator [Photobacterium sp. ZSDE20]MCQ1057673.1 LysR family transcriptional regulator [Photobacterium sp. ZSDE20]MDD1821922.1 LysR family transcriptional regulator [Photobacterium sp. ZSDE20]
MDIKTLRTFITVAKLKNFSAAARELHTVQPTVSRHVSELENELGVKLFQRTTHQVELTLAGEMLLPEALNIIANDQRVKTMLGQTTEQGECQINIGYLATACSFFLPTLLSRFTAANPNTQTNLFEMAADEQYQALTENKIDIAFSRRQPKLDGKQFMVETIYSDRLMAILPLNHPFAERHELSLSELRNERFILFQPHEWIEMYEHILLLCQESGFSPKVASHPDNMRHLVTSVSSGLGISIAPRCIKFIAQDNCVCIPITEVNLVLPLYMYYKRQGVAPQLSELVKACQHKVPDIQRMLQS